MLNHKDLKKQFLLRGFEEKIWGPWNFVRAVRRVLSEQISENEKGGDITRLINYAYALPRLENEIIGENSQKLKTISGNLGLLSKEEKIKFIKSQKISKEYLDFLQTKVMPLADDLIGHFLFMLRQNYGVDDYDFKDLFLKYNINFSDSIENAYKKYIKRHQEHSRTASAGQFKGGLADASEITIKYHTATHLLLGALRQLLSPEIYQKGSNITSERLRFDFNYPEKLSTEQLKSIEDLVNEKISEKIPVEMMEMSKDEALKLAKVSFDPSKYGDKVKLYCIGGNPSTSLGLTAFSCELCGGPHVKNTGELGKFKIIKEEASSAGVRRIKAVLE